MRRELLATCAAAALLVTSGKDASAQGSQWVNNLGVQLDLLLWQRTRGGDAEIDHFNGQVPGPGTRTFDFSDVSGNGTRPGLAVTGFYRIDPRQTVWVRGFLVGIFGNDQTLVSDPIGLGSSSAIDMAYATIPGTSTNRPGNTVLTGNSEQIFAAQIHTSSFVGGIEANYGYMFVQNPTWRLRGFAGPRWIQFFDRTQSTALDDVGGTFLDAVDIGVRNNLVGGQIGAEGRVRIFQNVFFEGMLSGGLYANLARRTRQFTSFFGGKGTVTGINDRLSETKFAQGLEGRVALVWQFYPGISAAVGYQGLWLNDVGVSQSQFASAANGNDRDIRANSDVWFHGINLGLTFRY